MLGDTLPNDRQSIIRWGKVFFSRFFRYQMRVGMSDQLKLSYRHNNRHIPKSVTHKI